MLYCYHSNIIMCLNCKKNPTLEMNWKRLPFPLFMWGHFLGNTSVYFNQKYFDLCDEQSLGSDPYKQAIYLYRLAGLTGQVWVPLACGRMSSILDLPSQTGRVCVCVCVLVAKSCPTLCHPLLCSLPGSSVRGIFQARIWERPAIPFSRGSSPTQGWDPALSHCRFFTI